VRGWNLSNALTCWAAGVLAIAFCGQAAVAAPPKQFDIPSAARRTPEPAAEPSNAGSAPSADRGRPLAQASHQTTREPLAISQRGGDSTSRAPGALRSIFGLFASLGAVVGLLLASMWGLKRMLPKDASALPSEVFQVLGRKPLAGRQQAQVVRFGNKVLLLAVSPMGAESLAEITDPAEVERLTGMCRQPTGGPAATVFRQVMDQFAREPAKGFVASGQASNLELAMRGLNRGKPQESRDA
jgi:flagellar biogenesis protein FliO